MRTLYIILFLCACVFIFVVNNIKLDLSENQRMRPVERESKIYPKYYDDDLHKEWQFILTKHYNDSDMVEWNEPNQARIVNPHGLGEGGASFVPPDDVIELMKSLKEENNYNLLASEMMSLHRSLPDPRHNECKALTYPEKLPTTSVIIIFHDEAWTTLLRTVWSVIDRSPVELLKEIILVDDMSGLDILKRPLNDYIETLPVHIKLIKNKKREGLIRARLIGAQHATGNVLTFLDAHVECCEGWLQPLLARIASDRSVVAVPLIDTLSSDDMGYKYNNKTVINGFRWTLIFNWMPIPERELVRTHYDDTAPIRTPTMIGCAFAIDNEFFFEIGSYDAGMNIWGSENMEMSLRVWQCGGSMEMVPCSHIGHLFRVSTYSFDGDADEIKIRNSIRLVEVWMSDLKEFYYIVNPRNRNHQCGNLTERFELKKGLKCKNFRWYLENVYPESNWNNEFIYLGDVKSAMKGKCLDIFTGGSGHPINVINCHQQGGNQVFGYTQNNKIVTSQEHCVGVDGKSVVSVKCVCNEPQMQWKYNNETHWLVHAASDLCMKADKSKVRLEKCDRTDDGCKWFLG